MKKSLFSMGILFFLLNFCLAEPTLSNQAFAPSHGEQVACMMQVLTTNMPAM